MFSWNFHAFLWPSIHWQFDLWVHCLFSIQLIWNVPLVTPIFLKKSLVFPFYCFPLFFCICHWRRLSLFSLLFSRTLHSSEYIFPFLASLLFSALCKASSGNQFAFLHFFFLGMVLVITSCTILCTSNHSSSGNLSTKSNHLNLFITPTYMGYNMELDLGHTWMAYRFSLLSSI